MHVQMFIPDLAPVNSSLEESHDPAFQQSLRRRHPLRQTHRRRGCRRRHPLRQTRRLRGSCDRLTARPAWHHPHPVASPRNPTAGSIPTAWPSCNQRDSESKFSSLHYCSAGYIEQAAAAEKPCPGPGPAKKTKYREFPDIRRPDIRI
jgi:hypothetical protein